LNNPIIYRDSCGTRAVLAYDAEMSDGKRRETSTATPTPPTPSTPPTYTALQLISVRDLRWQNYYKQSRIPYMLRNGVLLRPLYSNDYKNYSADSSQGVNISQLKMGYAVELQLELSDYFANIVNNNQGKVVIKVKTKVGNNDVTMMYRDNTGERDITSYQTIEIRKNSPQKDKFQIKAKDASCKKWTFVYYLPPTSYIASGDSSKKTVDIYFDKIEIYKNGVTTPQFDYQDFAEDQYGWNGHVFTYRTDKSALEDLGSNAN